MFTGLSFPIRIGNKGGLVISSADKFSAPHIDESLHQIVCTNMYERVMELGFGSNTDLSIFEPNDLSLVNLLTYELLDSISRQERRVTVEEKDITFTQEENKIYVHINYLVNNLEEKFSTKIYVGGE